MKTVSIMLATPAKRKKQRMKIVSIMYAYRNKNKEYTLYSMMYAPPTERGTPNEDCVITVRKPRLQKEKQRMKIVSMV